MSLHAANTGGKGQVIKSLTIIFKVLYFTHGIVLNSCFVGNGLEQRKAEHKEMD